ncbi:hypothetical protein HDV03_003817 [Kappamyces sp. JEL0829]|nr:hypothetical protein HDV03_003817 [Kappamyces sp. JEL0829]
MSPATYDQPIEHPPVRPEKGNGQVLRIGCVPEHFSAPLYLQETAQKKIVNCPGGTGEMIQHLESGTIDVAVALTEGIVVKAVNDLLDNASSSSPLQIVQSYTNSPLNWAIAVSPLANIKSTAELKTIGISRFGSGSHIMACVLANKLGLVFDFKVCGDIDGLIAAVNDGSSDAFMWEVITTKPYFDAGAIRMLDTFLSPWPSFVMASRHADRLQPQIASLSESVTASVAAFTREFSTTGKDYIMNQRRDVFHYNSSKDLDDWFANVSFAPNLSQISRKDLEFCTSILIQAGLIDRGRLDDWEREHGSAIGRICHAIVHITD